MWSVNSVGLTGLSGRSSSRSRESICFTLLVAWLVAGWMVWCICRQIRPQRVWINGSKLQVRADLVAIRIRATSYSSSGRIGLDSPPTLMVSSCFLWWEGMGGMGLTCV